LATTISRPTAASTFLRYPPHHAPFPIVVAGFDWRDCSLSLRRGQRQGRAGRTASMIVLAEAENKRVRPSNQQVSSRHSTAFHAGGGIPCRRWHSMPAVAFHAGGGIPCRRWHSMPAVDPARDARNRTTPSAVPCMTDWLKGLDSQVTRRSSGTDQSETEAKMFHVKHFRSLFVFSGFG
jgi:hypothetical protein